MQSYANSVYPNNNAIKSLFCYLFSLTLNPPLLVSTRNEQNTITVVALETFRKILSYELSFLLEVAGYKFS